MLKGRAFSNKSDIYSLGTLLYTLVTGKQVYKGKNEKEILVANKYFKASDIAKSKLIGVSQDCKSLIVAMLEESQNARPSAENCLRHPWFRLDREALDKSLFIN